MGIIERKGTVPWGKPLSALLSCLFYECELQQSSSLGCCLGYHDAFCLFAATNTNFLVGNDPGYKVYRNVLDYGAIGDGFTVSMTSCEYPIRNANYEPT